MALRDKIINWVMVLVPLTLLILVVSCNKDRTKSNTPEPIVQHDVVIDWTWGSGQTPGLAPSRDSIRQHSSKPDVRYVYINLVPMPGTYGSTWEPIHFNMVLDTVESRFEDNKVRGSGIIRVGRDGAQIHPDTLGKKYGMWITDSIRAVRFGYRMERFPPHGSR